MSTTTTTAPSTNHSTTTPTKDYALITGGSSGIGLSIAHLLHKKGIPLIIVSSTDHKLQAARDELLSSSPSSSPSVEAARPGEECEAAVEVWRVDMTTQDGCADFCRRVEGLPDEVCVKYLVQGVGFGQNVRFLECTEDDYDILSKLHKTIFFTTQCIARHMISRSTTNCSILFISSILSTYAMATVPQCVYATFKGAMNSLARQLASELSAHNIRVNALLPGAVDTPVFERQMGSREVAENFLREHAKLYVGGGGRVGESGEVARCAEFLLVEASWVTGAFWEVDGGVSAVHSGAV